MASDCSERHPLDQLGEEFVARYRRGERPSVTEFAQRYPEWADQLQELLQALVLMEDLGPDSGRPPEAAHQAPRRLGEYRILREVGRGGMGIVYEAEQESLGRHVALKVLPHHALMDPTHLERFRREAKAAAQLHHTNIVPVFGVGQQGVVHYYAMQFIEGQGLDEVLKEVRRLRQGGAEEGPPSGAAQGVLTGAPSHARPAPAGLGAPDQGAAPSTKADGPQAAKSTWPDPSRKYFQNVAWLGVQVAEALGYAHGQGILHRDIKPSNLLLDAHGTVWVTDFGLARAEGIEPLTDTGDVVGTVRYLAPERLAGRSDARSDVYSLGLTLYELATLRPAFTATDRPQLIRQVTHEEPPLPRRLDRRIPRDLETVILKAIAKESDNRYPSAGALAEDLRRFLADRPIEARRATWRERLWRWCRRNPALAGTGALALATLLAGLILVSWLWRRAEWQREVAQENERTAEQQRGRAQTNLERAMRAVDEMWTKVGKRWQQLPQMDRERRAILEQALKLYEEMLQDNSRERAVRLEVGKAHRRVGEICRLLGRWPEAELGFRRSLAVFEELAAEDASDEEARHEQAKSLQHLGMVLARASERSADAEQAFEKARNLMEALVSARPDNSAYRITQSRAYNNLATYHKQTGNYADAETGWNKTLAVWESVAGHHPNPSEYLRELAALRVSLGELFELMGRRDRAIAQLEQALPTLEGLARDPDCPIDCRRDLGVNYSHLGVLYHRNGRPADADAAFLKAVHIDERLARDHPDISMFSSNLGAGYCNMGNHYRLQRRPDTALDWYAKAISTLEPSLQRQPESRWVQSHLCNAYWGRAVILSGLGRPAEAVEACNRGLELAEESMRSQLRGLRALTRARLGEYGLATAEADEVLAIPNVSRNRLGEAAAVFALSSAAVREDPNLPAAARDRLADQYAARAFDLLRQAVAKGVVNLGRLKTDPDLEHLRARPEFPRLLSEVEAKAKTGAK